jgi:predicted dithiol-disulfide oxidoreductase (DUF899 family)
MSATPIPASTLVLRNLTRFPNESAAYRQARNALLVEEIELRRRIERVAARRRALPPGGVVDVDYRFEGATGTVGFAELFGAHASLVVYSWMYGPQRQAPCPMCTSLLSAWNGEGHDIAQRVALAVVARSPYPRLRTFADARGWQQLALYADRDGAYTRDYVSADDADTPAITVFERRDGRIRHFWSAEMGDWSADPGQDPRGAPDPMPLWTLLDMTPEGRGRDWYPKLAY